jgi:hypothetical protein
MPLPRFSFRYRRPGCTHCGPSFSRDLARAIRQRATIRHYIDGDLGRGCGRVADDHGTNSPEPGQRTAHHLSVMIAPFLDQFIETASRNFGNGANDLGPSCHCSGELSRSRAPFHTLLPTRGQVSERPEPSQSPGRALTPTARPTHSRSAVGRGQPYLRTKRVARRQIVRASRHLLTA